MLTLNQRHLAARSCSRYALDYLTSIESQRPATLNQRLCRRHTFAFALLHVRPPPIIFAQLQHSPTRKPIAASYSAEAAPSISGCQIGVFPTSGQPLNDTPWGMLRSGAPSSMRPIYCMWVKLTDSMVMVGQPDESNGDRPG